jgi:probable phosphoglycerate mutase
MTTARVLLIRHGQTDWNSDGRWQGQLDIPLNDEGIAQAEALAAHLDGRAIGAVHTSDLQRAYRTAEIVAEKLGVLLVADSRWREMNLGVFQGLTSEQIAEQYPDDHAGMRRDYLNYVIPQGESRRMMQERSQAALDAMLTGLMEDDEGGEIAVFSHGGTIKALLIRLFPDDEVIRNTSIPNTSITTIEYMPETGWRLLHMGETPHLSDEDEAPVNSSYIPKEPPPGQDGA